MGAESSSSAGCCAWSRRQPSPVPPPCQKRVPCFAAHALRHLARPRDSAGSAAPREAGILPPAGPAGAGAAQAGAAGGPGGGRQPARFPGLDPCSRRLRHAGVGHPGGEGVRGRLPEGDRRGASGGAPGGREQVRRGRAGAGRNRADGRAADDLAYFGAGGRSPAPFPGGQNGLKVMLTKDIENVGIAGEIKDVADGYGRNFLIPRKLAVVAGKGVEAEAKRIQQAGARREAKERDEAQALAERIGNKTVVVRLKVGGEDKAFGAITNEDIAVALRQQQQVDVDRRKIDLKEPIKQLGEHVVPLRLHRALAAQISLSVSQDR